MKLVKQIFLFIFSFTVTLCICDLFIKSSYISMVSISDFYSDIGRGNRKDLNFVYFNEGFGIGRINEHRYLGEANPLNKPDKNVRFVLLGDSYVESFQVFERDYFGNIAEKILSRKYSDLNFEFLNFGRSGFDIANIYAYQKTFAEKFDPDFYLFFISNAVLTPKNLDPLLPKILLKNDSLIISFNFDQSQISSFERSKFFIQNFSFLQMINNSWKKSAYTPMLPIFFEKFYFLFNPYQELSQIPEDNKAFVLSPITLKIFESLDPAKVIIVNNGYSKLHEPINELCQSRNLHVIDLSDLLSKAKESGNDLNYWKTTGKRGHWNHQGHEIIGKYITDRIIEITKNFEKSH